MSVFVCLFYYNHRLKRSSECITQKKWGRTSTYLENVRCSSTLGQFFRFPLFPLVFLKILYKRMRMLMDPVRESLLNGKNLKKLYFVGVNWLSGALNNIFAICCRFFNVLLNSLKLLTTLMCILDTDSLKKINCFLVKY